MKSLENQADDARVRSEATGAGNTAPPLTKTRSQEDHGVANYAQYNDSARADKIHQTDNWKSIGSLAAELVAKAVSK